MEVHCIEWHIVPFRRDAFLEEDAHRIARLIASENATRVYKL